MAGIRVRLSSTTALCSGVPAIRIRLAAILSATGGTPAVRVRFAGLEDVSGGQSNPNVKVRFAGVEGISGGQQPPAMRTRLCVVESLQEILEEVMATEVFPGIDPSTGQTWVCRGLAFDVKKSPMFSNKIVEHTSGEESATSYWENPKWSYSLTFDYLPDRPVTVGETDLRMMMGFFLNMRGRFQTWLFKDPDDYQVTAGFQKTFDGVTVDFKLVRGMQGFYEPIGQLNTDEDLDIWLQADEDHVIGAGPYTATVNHAGAMTSVEPSVHIGATLLTLTGGAPGINQYQRSGGTFTFNSGREGQTATINYQYLVDPADYTFVLPNVVQFDVAPVDGAIATASFQYYFVCRFLEDVAEYNKFMNQLWELNELNFRSIPQ